MRIIAILICVLFLAILGVGAWNEVHYQTADEKLQDRTEKICETQILILGNQKTLAKAATSLVGTSRTRSVDEVAQYVTQFQVMIQQVDHHRKELENDYC